MLNILIDQLKNGIELHSDQIESAVHALLSSAVSTEEKSNFLIQLKNKGETVSEIVEFIKMFKKFMRSVTIDRPVLDIVGTGGDGVRTVNLSTGAALLAAASGVPVAKHGNRAISSHCGSADVLEALKIPLTLPIEELVTSITNHQFGFFFAPIFNVVLKDLQILRRMIGQPTIFNLLGPFLNPANAQHYVLGVSSENLLSKFAEILYQLNVDKSVVLHGNGMDEISTMGLTNVAEVYKNSIRYYTIDPSDFGLKYCKLADLQRNSIHENANALLEAFDGKKSPIADSLALNAGMGLYVYGHVRNLGEGFQIAKNNLTNGSVLQLIKTLRTQGLNLFSDQESIT